MKLLGSALVIASCGGLGFKIASGYLREEKMLRQLIGLLDFMECELQYHLTPLPYLCRQAASEAKGVITEIFLYLAQELEDQISPDVERCMNAALNRTSDIPEITYNILTTLGKSLGRFDLEGQMKGLEAVRKECRRNMEELEKNKEIRIRGYKTLGLCAGAALVIIFV